VRGMEWVLMALAVVGASALAVAQERDTTAANALPETVAKAINDNCPGSVIDRIALEREGRIVLYDVEFRSGKGEIEVAADGTVMDISTNVEMKDIPGAAAGAIRKAAADATISQLERSEIRAEIRKQGALARIVKLPAPRFVYEAELAKGDRRGEIQVAPDGKVVEKLRWTGGGEKN
jgi:hypothetical protein